MEPTINSGDIALGERHPKNVSQGDVLLLKSPLEPEELIVKRLKGMPGDIKRYGFMFSEVCLLLCLLYFIFSCVFYCITIENLLSIGSTRTHVARR